MTDCSITELMSGNSEFAGSEFDGHLREAKHYLEDARKEGMAALIAASIIVASAATASDIARKSPLPEGSVKESFADAIEGIGGLIGGGAILLGAGAVALSGAKVAYHHLKAWQIERKEAKEELYKIMFYWPISPNNSHLNGNL